MSAYRPVAAVYVVTSVVPWWSDTVFFSVDTVRLYSRRCCETAAALIQPVLPLGLCGSWTLSQSFWALTTRNVSGAPEGCGLSKVETTAPVGVARTSMRGPTAVAAVPTDCAGVGDATGVAGVGDATGVADAASRVWSATFGLAGVHPARSRRMAVAVMTMVGRLKLMLTAFICGC